MDSPFEPTLGERLARLAADDPRADAIAAPGRATMTRADLDGLARRCAADLAGWGFARGDLLAWAVAGRPETAAANLVVPAAATQAPLAPATTATLADEILDRMRPKALAVDAASSPAWREAAARHGVALVEVEPQPDAPAGIFTWRLARAARSLEAQPRLAPGIAYLCTTSGTTGRAKFVPLAHRKVLWTSREVGRLLAVGPGDRSAALTPLFLANGLRTVLLLPLLAGGAVECLPEGSVDALVERMRAGRVTFTSAAFTIVREWLARLERGAAEPSPSLRFVRPASGALEPAEAERLERALGAPVVAGLAATETGIITHQRLPPARRAAGTLGPPFGCEIRIVDDRGEDVPAGAIGEVQVRGPQVFDGYFDDPALDAASFVDGWFRIGDLGVFDDDRNLRLVGRAREIINRGGEKIAPSSVDMALRALPGVADGAGFGVPHATLGEEVVAAVVLGDAASFREDDALARLRDHLGPKCAPKRLWVVDALPRNAAGKVRRTELVARFAPAAAAEAEEASTPLDAAVAALWASVFERDDWPPGATFDSLGGDERHARALADAVRALFGVDFDPVRLGEDAPTPAAMARALEARLANG